MIESVKYQVFDKFLEFGLESDVFIIESDDFAYNCVACISTYEVELLVVNDRLPQTFFCNATEYSLSNSGITHFLKDMSVGG